MNDKNNGGPAFPWTEVFPDTSGKRHLGLSLRDYFAAQVVQGLIAGAMADGSSFDPRVVGDVANAAYLVADAMLAEREKEGSQS